MYNHFTPGGIFPRSSSKGETLEGRKPSQSPAQRNLRHKNRIRKWTRKPRIPQWMRRALLWFQVPTTDLTKRKKRTVRIQRIAVTEQNTIRVEEFPQFVDQSPAAGHCAIMSTLNGFNAYVTDAPALESSLTSFKETMDTLRDVLGRWTKKVGEATRKAEDLAGNTWQHLRTSPSFAEAAMGIIAQGTKVLAEGGYEKIFRQTFETVPEEQLENSFACYLSTSAGPVMGVLYVSTAKLAYCSDSRLAYKTGSHTEWNYYKVVIPLHQLKSVNPSTSRVNHSEKYIQVISLDSHEFWFMGFLYYDAAVKCLQDVLQLHSFHFV
ncbi:hypothetical protein ES319_D12G086100v1 [Gossypium barbadense]|uniref:GRAM domain-containing protein n=1 Tax=Gossypium barbadense TaxID=3634 RepID=A0A5J5NVT1_GOSBA|nr:hypothetical protein ES319_D12G086100v1 [Gossypium barbadense]